MNGSTHLPLGVILVTTAGIVRIDEAKRAPTADPSGYFGDIAIGDRGHKRENRKAEFAEAIDVTEGGKGGVVEDEHVVQEMVVFEYPGKAAVKRREGGQDGQD
jgi:hypothetical protein